MKKRIRFSFTQFSKSKLLYICVIIVYTLMSKSLHAQVTSLRFPSNFASAPSYTFSPSNDVVYAASGSLSTSTSGVCGGGARRTQSTVLILQLVSTSASIIDIPATSSGSAIRTLTNLETSTTLAGTYSTVVGYSSTSNVGSSCGILQITDINFPIGTFIKFTFSGNINVSGFDISPAAPIVAPSTQASNIVFSNIAQSGFTATWTNGNGARRAVFVKEGTQGTITNPVDGDSYTASADWTTKGTQLGTSGYYCVYNGTSNTVNLTGLNPNTTYWLQVFEYNGVAATSKFLTATASNNPNNTTTLAPPPPVSFRTKQSGDWNDLTTWESSTDNLNWVNAVSIPNSDAAFISIRNSDSVCISGTAVSVGDGEVQSNAKLTISSTASSTFTANSGSKVFTIHGKLTNAFFGASSPFTTSASALIFSSTGVFDLAAAPAANTATHIPTATWNAGSTCKITGLVGVANADYTALNGVAQAFSNFEINMPNFLGKLLLQNNAAVLSIENFIVNATGATNTGSTTGVQTSTATTGRTGFNVTNYIQNGGLVHIVSNSSNATNRSFTASGNFTINAGTFNIASYTAASAGTSTLNIAGNIFIGSGAVLQKDLTTPNTIGNHGTAVLNLNGNTQQTITLNASDALISVQNFTLNNSAGATLTGSGKVDVNGIYTPTSGTLTTGGLLTLKSTANTTARIAAGTGSYITGNVTTETYIPGGRRAYRFLGHPFTTAQAMSSLTDDIFVTGDGTVDGIGNSTGAGFDATATNAPSSYWFDNTTNTWKAFTTAADASWAQHRGARVLVRGDRTQANALTGATYTPNPVTLDMTGTVNSGNQTINLTNANNYHLVSNPYPSPTDIGTVIQAASNLGTLYWVWNANAGARGQYVNRLIVDGAYNLAMNGAFFVQPTASTSLAFTESNKQATATQSLFRTANSTRPAGYLELAVKQNNEIADNIYIRDLASALTTKDVEDGGKLINPDINIYTLTSNNEQLTLDARPISSTTLIPVVFTSSMQSNFSIDLVDNGFNNGLPIVLKDKYLNVEHVLTANSPYNFAVTNDAASQGTNRFELVFRTSAALPTNFVNVAAQQKGSAIEVTFTTANESNMQSYEVEESKDGTSFTKGTTLEAKNAASNSYNWLDVNIHNGNNYYRVKAIEKNGTIKYSQVVRVNVGKQTADFAVYPNPVKGGIVNLQLTDIEKGVYTVRVLNNLGQEIANKQINHNGGSATQTISIGNVPTGKYNMLITNGTSTVTKTVIVE